MLLDYAAVLPIGDTPGAYFIIDAFLTLTDARELVRWVKGAIVIPRSAL